MSHLGAQIYCIHKSLKATHKGRKSGKSIAIGTVPPRAGPDAGRPLLPAVVDNAVNAFSYF